MRCNFFMELHFIDSADLPSGFEGHHIEIDCSHFDSIKLSMTCGKTIPFKGGVICNDFSKGEAPLYNNPDLFHERIHYNHLDISRIDIISNCIPGKNRNSYTYDPLHRLKTVNNTIFKQDQLINGRYNEAFEYDEIGNILNLSRNGYSEI